MKILPVGAELFHVDGRTDGDGQTDRRTDITKLIVAFRNFEKEPKTNRRRGHRYLTDLSGNYFYAKFTANIYVYICMCVCACVCVSLKCSR